MIYDSLIIEGFKVFREELEFKFPTSPGLYFMHGINNVEERLGANGTGKSSLWDALCWLNYGKTCRGLGSNNIVPWGDNKKTRVSGNVYIGDRIHTVERFRSPNKIILDGREIEQTELTEFLGIDYAPFLNSIVFGQFNAKFLDLKPVNRLKLFTDVLDLEVWINRSSESKDVVFHLESKIIIYEKRLVKVEADLDNLFERLEDYKVRLEEWVSTRNANAGVLKDRRVLLNGHLLRAQHRLKHLYKEVDYHGEAINKKYRSLAFVDSQIRKCNNFINKFEKAISKLWGKFEIEKEKLDFFKVVGAKKCPTCEQIISKDHSIKMTNDAYVVTKKIGKEITKLEKNKAGFQDNLEKQRDRFGKKEILLGRSKTKKAECGVLMGSKKNEVLRLKAEILELDNAINVSCAEESPYLKDMGAIEKRIAVIKREKSLLNRVIENKEAEIIKAKYWIKGFRDIRLFIIEKYLKYLEFEANSVLARIGLPDWKILFITERETKSKTIERGLKVLIQNPDNSKMIPWESYCGGESQRLVIAVNIGLSNLILASSGVSCNIEVWDEPSAWLSKEGIEDMLDIFYDRAKQESKQIWLVDQRMLEYGGFEKIYTVVRDKGGSKIEHN